MKDIMTALIALCGTQSLALSAVADHVSALKTTLLFHYPELGDDLNAQMSAEKEKNKELVEKMQQTLAELQEAVSRLSN